MSDLQFFGVGVTIASFIKTARDTQKTFFPNRERFGLKIQGHGTGLPQKSWNEWIENDSEPQKGGAFTLLRNLNVVNEMKV